MRYWNTFTNTIPCSSPLSVRPAYGEFNFEQFQLQQLHNSVLQREEMPQKYMLLSQQAQLQEQIQNEIQLAQLRWWDAHSNPMQQPALQQFVTNNNYNYKNNGALQQPLSYSLVSPFAVQQQQQYQQSSTNNAVQCTKGICNTLVTECVNGLCMSTINGAATSPNQECSNDCSIQQTETSQCVNSSCTSTFTECINGLCNSTNTRT